MSKLKVNRLQLDYKSYNALDYERSRGENKIQMTKNLSVQKPLETPGFDPGASRMRSARSTN